MIRLTSDEVKKIAALARTHLKETEIAKFQTELSEIIGYNSKKLSEITKTPLIEFRPGVSLGQRDEARPSLTSEEALANAPKSERGFFVVPKVLGQ